MQDNFLGRMSRRQFLCMGVGWILRTGLVYSANRFSQLFSIKNKKNKVSSTVDEIFDRSGNYAVSDEIDDTVKNLVGEGSLEEKTLSVKMFSQDISRLAYEKGNIDQDNLLNKMVLAYGMSDLFGTFAKYVMEWKDVSYKVIDGIGVFTGATGKFIDLLSTYMCISLLNDPKMHEYGLDLYFFETNPLYSTKNNAVFFGISGLNIVLTGLTGKWFFPVGTGLLGMAAPIVKSNLSIAATMGYALNYGTRIEQMINDGSTRSEVEQYLSDTYNILRSKQISEV